MGKNMLQKGTLLQDRFLIEEQIGLGGMGAVYMAVDQKFGSKVAIKETFYSAELAEAFEREARLLNGLHHPVLPHVSDYFSEGDEHLLVMEYIEGEDLSEILKRGETLPFDDVIRWTLELLDALDYLHSQDPPIIHRDIKPNNLKVTSRGNIVLLDFGLAKETSANTLGMNSVFGYSRRYSPLEQIEGTGTDTRSDLFALGATVFHLLTGTPPVDVLARASAIVAGQPDPLRLASDLNPTVPLSFSKIIRSSLELNADKRFLSAPAMKNALEFAVAGDTPVNEAPVSVQPASAPVNMPPPAPVESFAALEAFRDDTDPELVVQNAGPETVEPVPAFDGPREQTVPILEASTDEQPNIPAAEGPNIAAGSAYSAPNVMTPVWAFAANAFRRSPILWAMAILALASIVTYSVYLSTGPATATADNGIQNVAGTGTGDSTGNSPSTEVPLSGAEPAAADAKKVDQKAAVPPRKKDQPSTARSGEQTESEAEPEPDPNADLPERPRVVEERTKSANKKRNRKPPPAEYYQPPASDIEVIMTGEPPPRRDRRPRKPHSGDPDNPD